MRVTLYHILQIEEPEFISWLNFLGIFLRIYTSFFDSPLFRYKGNNLVLSPHKNCHTDKVIKGRTAVCSFVNCVWH